MAVQREFATDVRGNEQDHYTWSALCERQMSLVANCACQPFHDGFPLLQLNPTHLPDRAVVSQRLERLSGWTLSDAQAEVLDADAWFGHLNTHRFPVLHSAGRKIGDDALVPYLFHTYFGHLALLTDYFFADTVQMFGSLYLAANKRQRQEIARLWWFSVEFGLIHEEGQLKVLGAGLLSSPGELQHALNPGTSHAPFDIRRVVQTSPARKGYHDTYFVLDDLCHVRRIIQEYARMEGLPVPQSAL